MRSIFIHHHLEDVLAAEIIAGAIVSIAQVEIISYPPGPQVIVQTPPGQPVENVVIWTEEAEAEPLMDSLLRGLAVRRARCTLLLHHGVTPPDDVIRCDNWPLFDRSTPWTTYRRTLRSLFGDTSGETERKRPAPLVRVKPPAPRFGFSAAPIPGLPGWLIDYPILPNMVLGGILLWALLK